MTNVYGKQIRAYSLKVVDFKIHRAGSVMKGSEFIATVVYIIVSHFQIPGRLQRKSIHDQ
jgi:hypothetical protein